MPNQKKPFLSDSMYDKLKWVAQILLPALGTLYFALSGTLELPAAEQVVGTIVAVDAFLGALLGLSTANFNRSEPDWDGTLVVAENDNSLIHRIELDTLPEDLKTRPAVILKVEQGPPGAPVPLKE